MTLEEALEHEPCDAAVLLELNALFLDPTYNPDVLSAIADGASRCPGVELNTNNYAWALATLPSDALRDGARAVEIARDLTDGKATPNPGFLDTLAAAFAESGDYERAIQVQDRAIELLRSMKVPDEVVRELEEHLDSFKAGRPIRSKSGAS